MSPNTKTKMAGNLNAEKENEQFAQFESVKRHSWGLFEKPGPETAYCEAIKILVVLTGARTSGRKK
jgi:hypothetical protein